jgi:putative ABC transport system substrate-binding protein
MQRRGFITLLGGAAATWPLAARAQQKAMPVIGYLNTGSPDTNPPLLAAFRQGLSETGYVEGQNLAIEYRWAEGHYDRLPALAADLVGRKVNVIVASTGVSALAAQGATATIPIVFGTGGDPVADGLLASLARPGGNLTGVTGISVELNPKRFELLSELVPQASAIALLVNPNSPSAERVMRDTREAARSKGRQLHILKANTESEDRRRRRHPRPTALRRARRPHRPVLHQPARAARGAGGTLRAADDLSLSRSPRGRWPDELRSQPGRFVSPSRHLHRVDSQRFQAR